jgi:hypothetical protein
MNARDARYREELLTPVRKCAQFKPKFGALARNKDGEQELSLDGFLRLYRADPLYAWLGLDSPLMYAAHKAAGGMTSIYRQLGIGCERLVRAVIGETLGLDREQMKWTYEAVDEKGKINTLTLDARIEVSHLDTVDAKERVCEWLVRAGRFVARPSPQELVGVIFEVRQGYKSADSKRQKADLAFGTRAGLNKYLPAVMIMSTQISVPVIARYRAASMLVLTGSTSEDDTRSTFAFFDNVIGYSLTGFFERNADILREEVGGVLAHLLSASNDTAANDDRISMNFLQAAEEGEPFESAAKTKMPRRD